MEIINLATSKKQDIIINETDKIESIRRDTSYIRNQLPTNVDLTKYNHFRRISSTHDTGEYVSNWTKVYSLSGQGFITSFSVDGSFAYTRFIIDGQTVPLTFYEGPYKCIYAGLIFFNSSIVLEYRYPEHQSRAIKYAIDVSMRT